MKKIVYLFVVSFLMCSCGIFDNGSDGDSNNTPFEGSWRVLLGEYTFKGNLVSRVTYGNSSESYFNKAFTYDETTKKVKIDTIIYYYLIKNNQLLLGEQDSKDGFSIPSFQNSKANSVSSVKMVVSGTNPINVSYQATLNSNYKDKNLVLDSLRHISVQSFEFVSYKDTNRSVSIVISNPADFSSLNTGVEVSTPFLNEFYVSLDGYDANNKNVGNEIGWTISKFKLKNYSYDPSTSLKAVFYDLKNYAGTTLLDTLELNIDLSNLDAFKTMLKGL